MGGLKIFGGVALATLVLPALALAQDPAVGGYGGPGGNAQNDVAGAGGGVAGALPFTGLDLALMVAAAIMLVGAGLLMRRYGRARA